MLQDGAPSARKTGDYYPIRDPIKIQFLTDFPTILEILLEFFCPSLVLWLFDRILIGRCHIKIRARFSRILNQDIKNLWPGTWLGTGDNESSPTCG